MQSLRHLSWKDRPDNIKELITNTFDKLKNGTNAEWTKYRGAKDPYYSININEFEFIVAKMKKLATYSDVKEFYVLDIGAGDFGFGALLVSHINRRSDLPEGITLHVIGIRGEKHQDVIGEKIGKCIVYELGYFPVENLLEEFQKRKLDLVNKIDLIVSRMTFRHLVDPMGTMLQAFELLRPKNGMLMFDGFFYTMPELKSKNYHEGMMAMLKNTAQPYLCYQMPDALLSRYALCRSDDKPLQLSLCYSGLYTSLAPESTRTMEANSGYICQFHSGLEFKLDYQESKSINKAGQLTGDADLYWYLQGIMDNRAFDKHTFYIDKSASIELITQRKCQALGIDTIENALNSLEDISQLATVEMLSRLVTQLLSQYASLSDHLNYVGMRLLSPEMFSSSKPYDPLVWPKVYSRVECARDSIYSRQRIKPILRQLEDKASELKCDLPLMIRTAIPKLVEEKVITDSRKEEFIKKSYEKGYLDKPISACELFEYIGRQIEQTPWAFSNPSPATQYVTSSHPTLK